VAAGVRGARVIWASNDRSKATRDRARHAGLHDIKTLPDLVHASDVILAVCPPHAAFELARSVADLGFTGVYVDANAVAPATAKRIGETLESAGASFVDGGIIGSPARQPGTTRLYLSGPRAREVAELFSGSLLEAKTLDTNPGSASALKMAYAAWTKGSDALLIAIRALAASEGVEQALLEEWAQSKADLIDRSTRAAERTAPKAWRYAGEMREIAATFEAVGLTPDFHNAAAEIYDRLAGFKDMTGAAPAAEAVIDSVRKRER